MMTRRFASGAFPRGFTLIEVLVTTSLFSIVMSVLLIGVFSGTRAWDQADQHLQRRARLRTALEQFSQDAQTAQQALSNGIGLDVDAQGRPALFLRSLETRPGSPWAGALLQVEWSLVEEERGLAWIRKTQPLIGDALAGSLETEFMLEEVDELHLEVRQGGTWDSRLDAEGPPADLIRLRLRTPTGLEAETVVPLTPGEASGIGGERDEAEENDPEGEEDTEGGFEEEENQEAGSFGKTPENPFGEEGL